MDTTTDPPPKKTQKLCTLRTHEPSQFKEDVVFDPEKFSELKIVPGTLVQVAAVIDIPQKRNGKSENGATQSPCDPKSDLDESGARQTEKSSMFTYDETGKKVPTAKVVDTTKTFVFVAYEVTEDDRERYQNVGVCIYIAFTTGIMLSSETNVKHSFPLLPPSPPPLASGNGCMPL
jgi:hypothetical protein